MAEQIKIQILKKWLLDDVASLSQYDSRSWKEPISDTVREIRQLNLPAVYFGGTLRSLLFNRLFGVHVPGRAFACRPRDIDVVLGVESVCTLEDYFKAYIIRKTRFGGLHLRRHNWIFDMWPLQETYAFRNNIISDASFTNLPKTTFFNLESIAVDIWPLKTGLARNIYSHDDAFFKGLLRKEIEINNAVNPFPDLCVIRSFVLAYNLGWKVGPNLLTYLAEFAPGVSDAAFENIQLKHYGSVEVPSAVFRSSLNRILVHLKSSYSSLQLFKEIQPTFWPGDEDSMQRIKLRQEKLRRIRHGQNALHVESISQSLEQLSLRLKYRKAI